MDPHGAQPISRLGAPLGEGKAVMIMIHGRGTSAEDILGLVPSFMDPSFTYLAPSAQGHTWYPYSFLSDIGRNEPFLSSALNLIGRMVDDVVAKGISRQRVLLLGFSQGACLAAEFAVRHPARYGGVIALSGGLIGPPGTVWDETAGTFARTPVFLGCSNMDPHIPKERVDDSADVFTRMGARTVERIYPGMGHTVNGDEIAFVRSLMDEIS